jgi:aminoglycoside phosphotransferase family enzyme/predicted kinase
MTTICMAGNDVPSAQKELIASLATALQNQDGQFQLFETHISWVLVSGEIAYKFKKAVRFDFVDYSTLDARHLYCREELRLNRRLASQLYLDFVKITGTPRHPVIGGSGSPIEYAIRMRAFAQEALWEYRIGKGLVSGDEADALAIKLARFHQAVSVAPIQSSWGSSATLQKIAAANLDAVAGFMKNRQAERAIPELTEWITAEQKKLHGTFSKRKALGFIRECHGDLHIRNILTLNGQVEVFDCIEFNDSLRWIDVMNDIAFLCMDLKFHQRPDLAARIRNQYLALTGDHEGLAVLRYYEVQRALTRCKVAFLKAEQPGSEIKRAGFDEREAMAYLAYAIESINKERPAIMITHGYSGSGKSFFSARVVELVGAIQLRSDVERKRMAGIAPGTALYSTHFTRRTYQRLRALTRRVVEAGWPVIVDAAFLKMEQRRLFQNLAGDLGVPFFIFDIHASELTLRTRIVSREKEARDPSDAGLEVLARQVSESEPLTADETGHAIPVNLEFEPDASRVRNICGPVLKALAR